MSENKQRIMRSPKLSIPDEILDQRKESELPDEFIRRIAKEKGLTRQKLLKQFGIPNPQWYSIHESVSGEIVLIDEEELNKIKSKNAPTEKINWKGKKWELTEMAYNEWYERVKTEPIDLNEVFAEYADRYLWHREDVLTKKNLQSNHDWALANGKYENRKK